VAVVEEAVEAEAKSFGSHDFGMAGEVRAPLPALIFFRGAPAAWLSDERWVGRLKVLAGRLRKHSLRFPATGVESGLSS
jgi:hypothetical protein